MYYVCSCGHVEETDGYSWNEIKNCPKCGANLVDLSWNKIYESKLPIVKIEKSDIRDKSFDIIKVRYLTEIVNEKDVPVLKAIFETPTEKTQYYRMLNKFYNYREENERFEHNLREYAKSASPLDHAKYLNYVNPDKPSVEIRRMGVFKNYEKEERRINKILDIPNLSENYKEALEEYKTRLKVDAVKRLDQIK